MTTRRDLRSLTRRAGRHALAVTACVLLSLLAGGVRAEIHKGRVMLRLEPVAAGLTSPTSLTHAGDGSGRLFLTDQTGRIRIIRNGILLAQPFLDLSDRLPALNPGFDERGLLGVAFHPDYARNGRFFVRYSAPRPGDPSEPCFGTSRGCHEEILAEFHVSPDPDVADPVGTILFRVDKPQFNHNSGTVLFGPDGYLYFTLGDGGGANDGLADTPPSHGPIGNGQNIHTPLGALLRIDVDHPAQPPRAYAIPPDNPFVGRDGLDEIYAYGLRNPFRFAFDDGPGGDGRLFLADVGQNLFEEVDIIRKGGNYGWVIREGLHCFDPFNPFVAPATCASTGPSGEPLLDPIVDYSHAEGGISIIGGFVYRGRRSPDLVGRYLFGDFSASFGAPGGRLYYLDPEHAEAGISEFINGPDDAPYGKFLKSFGEGADGEVYALASSALGPTGNGGVVQRLVEMVNPTLDIKPGACPNRLNRVSRGSLPMALLGRDGFDVSRIDPATLALRRAAPVTALAADLDGDQAGTGSSATGHASMTLDRESHRFCMDLAFEGLLGEQTVQHVHGPAAPGQSAGVLFGIPGPGGFSGFCTTLTDPQQAIILAGLAYVNVHSTRNSGGEIRGQIRAASVAPLRVHLEDVGGPGDDRACGCPDSHHDGIPDLVLQFDNEEVIKTLVLEAPGNGASSALTVDGHREPLGQDGLARFNFGMDGLQEEMQNTSLGKADCTVALDPVAGNVTVGCSYEGLEGTAAAAHIHGPAQPGVSAPVIVPLATTGGHAGTVTGGGTLTPEQVQGMLDGLTYVNIHTDLRPMGEIRGQIVGGELFTSSDCVQVIRRRAANP